MFVLSGKRNDLCHLGFSKVFRVDAAHGRTFRMYFEHDLGRAFMVHAKNCLQHLNDEFHRRVIIVEQYHLVQPGGLDRTSFEQRCVFPFCSHHYACCKFYMLHI